MPNKTFSVLGVVLLLEVVPVGAVILVGEDSRWISGFVPACFGGVAFYCASQGTR